MGGREDGEGGKRPLIVIVGPTAAGKSALALHLARLFNTEIISADSMQVYKGMDIGTAKPSGEEMEAVPHHMISMIEPDTRFSVGDYVSRARPVITGLHERGKIPIVAGGTGLYVRALVDGLCEAPKTDWILRKRLLSEEAEHGKGYLYRRLCEVDPVSAGRTKPNDTIRVIRSLEVYESGGVPLSDIQEVHGFKERPYDPVIIGLTMERKNLYKKIEERVDRMMEAGLEAEVRGLIAIHGGSVLPMHGLGYKQLAGYIKGMYSLEDAIRLLKRDTRRYAKRQLTWFRRDDRIRWYTAKEDLSHLEEIGRDIRSVLPINERSVSNE
ncbi:MAG: tRNA (adenosine(37)-N6)-dimethylallyltransferase MiaA [Nitrospirae bacterium]|nr:tRNA (adenosine(37)-N6)-dimethylallyltransferase MiaA [Nitrospirota bacterium]